jgi:hypothetical protein
MEDMCTSRFAWLLQISSATRTLAAQLCSLNSDPSQDPELALERAMHLMFDLVSNQMHALGAQENSIVRLGSQLNWQDDRFDTDSTPQHGPHLVEHGALPLGPSKSFPEVYEFDGRPPVDDALRHSRYALIAGMKVVIYQIADKYESVQNALKKLWWHLMGEMTTNHYLITWHDGFVIAQAWEHLGFGKQFCFLENFEVHHYAIFRWQQTAALACVKEPSVRQTDSYLTDCCQEMRCSGFTRFWRTGVLGLENDHYALFGASRMSSLITLSTSLMTSSVRISPSITTRSRRANTCPTTIAQSAMICTKLALKFEHTKTSQLPTQLTRLTRTVPPMT